MDGYFVPVRLVGLPACIPTLDKLLKMAEQRREAANGDEGSNGLCRTQPRIVVLAGKLTLIFADRQRSSPILATSAIASRASLLE
jgi:hypothetical protein